MIRDPAYEDWVGRARSVSVADEIARRGIALRPTHAVERCGPCPACGGTDRFSINTTKNVFHCRGAGAGGDAIALVQYLDGVDFTGACEILTGEPPPRRGPARADSMQGRPGSHVDREAIAAREAERRQTAEARALDAARGERDYREEERRRAWTIWRAGAPAAGTLLDAYFEARGLGAPEGFPIRFAPDLAYWHEVPTGEPGPDGKARRAVIHSGPAMLLPIVRRAILDGRAVWQFSAIHMTWLAPDGSGKAVIADPSTGEMLPARKMRGSKSGGHIRLGGRAVDPDARPDVSPGARCEEGAGPRLVVGEGVETVLTVKRAEIWRRGEGVLGATEYWASGDLGNLAGQAEATIAHPSATFVDKAGRTRHRRVPGPVPRAAPTKSPMYVPAAFAEMLLLADGDSDPFMTRMAMQRAGRVHARPGRTIRVAWPGDGLDFNDLGRGKECG